MRRKRTTQLGWKEEIEYARSIAAIQGGHIGYHDLTVSFEETEAEAAIVGDKEEHEAAANTYGDAIT